MGEVGCGYAPRMAPAGDEEDGAPEGLALLPAADPMRPVPWRTILATIASVVVVYLAYLLLRELGRIIAWLIVAGFFAVVLAPAVDIVQRQLHARRAPATALVFLVGFGLLAGLLYSFIRPIVDQVDTFIGSLPELVDDARDGRGAIGRFIERYELAQYVEDNEQRVQEALSGAGSPALGVLRSFFNGVFSFVTILVLSFLMLLRGPELCRGALALVSSRHRERVRLIASDAARAVSGYMFGNLVISLIAGVATYIFLRIAGVPYAEVIALFVAFCDLIPLVGATLGAIPTIGLAFLHSTPAGIAAVIFYIVYQQFENHFLQVTIMSRSVDVNPLAVLVSVLAGVELFGFLGALLAIPAAGIIQVIVRNLYDERAGRLKLTPTVGASERSVDDVAAARRVAQPSLNPEAP